MKQDPKKAAAVSAVAAYIKLEEEALSLMEAESPAAAEGEGQAAGGPAAPMSLWGMSGRQQQMQMRSLVQMKALHRGSGRR
jgi:hypothetical protein